MSAWLTERHLFLMHFLDRSMPRNYSDELMQIPDFNTRLRHAGPALLLRHQFAQDARPSSFDVRVQLENAHSLHEVTGVQIESGAA